MKSLKFAVAAMAFSMGTQALAQSLPDSDEFLKAVEKENGEKATDLLNQKPGIINVRNGKGDTGLIIAIRNQAANWVGFLLNKGADANLAGANGDTPLIAAVRSDMIEALGWLLEKGAKVNAANKAGETPLIIAVQQRNVRAVGALLEAGADPDRTDAVAGYSARDYAKRDGRMPEIQRLLNAGKAKN